MTVPTGAGLAEGPLSGAANNGPERGNNVAISGDTIALGSNGSVDAAGQVKVFRWSTASSTWSLEQTVTGSTARGFEWYGSAVALDSNRMIVGAFMGNSGNNGEGTAYVYSRSDTTWTQEGQLFDSTLPGGAYFGWAVGISGSTAAVGAPHAYTAMGLSMNGEVEIFSRGPNGKWTRDATLTTNPPQSNDDFGTAIALSGESLLVGAPGHWNGTAGTQPGAAHLYTGAGATWTEQATLTASDGVAHDLFGYSVAQSGSIIAIGAPWHAHGAYAKAGAVYVFAYNGAAWVQQAELVAPDATANAEFGNSVAVTGSTVVVGAPGPDKVYAFTQSGATWSWTATHTACSGQIGESLSASNGLAVTAAKTARVFDLADPNTACVP